MTGQFDTGEDLPWDERPKTRADCVDGPRPCPWYSCRYHLAVDPTSSADGGLRLLFDVTEQPSRPSCALDVADKGGSTLDEVGAALGITKERIRQVESKGLAKLEKRARRMGMRPEELLVDDVASPARGGWTRVPVSPSKHQDPRGRQLCEWEQAECFNEPMPAGALCEEHTETRARMLAFKSARAPRRVTPHIGSADDEFFTGRPVIPALARGLMALSLAAALQQRPDVQEPLDLEAFMVAPDLASNEPPEPEAPRPQALVLKLPAIQALPAPAPQPEARPPRRAEGAAVTVAAAPSPAVVPAPPAAPTPSREVPMATLCSKCQTPLHGQAVPLGKCKACRTGASPAPTPTPAAPAKPRLVPTPALPAGGLAAKRRALQEQLRALEAETRARIKALRDEADQLEAELDEGADAGEVSHG